MATLYFTGDQVAFFGGMNDTGTATQFTGVKAPFLPGDTVEIVIPDKYIRPDGEFDPNLVIFTSVTVVRDGVRYDFRVNAGSKIKETGSGEVKEQGDTFFTTNDAVGPPSSGPFAGLAAGKMVFANTATFRTGQTTTITRDVDQDFNADGDMRDAGETGNARYNVTPASDQPCFAAGTLIGTPDGQRPVETLSDGDFVALAGGGPGQVVWAGRHVRRFGRWPHPHKPILIARGALGPGRPARDLVVSPQHGVLIGRGQLDVQGCHAAAFAPAKALVGLPGIRQMQGTRRVGYCSLLLDRHAAILAAGALAESFYPGPAALAALPGRLREEIAALFPGVADDPERAYGARAYPALTVRAARAALAVRRPAPALSALAPSPRSRSASREPAAGPPSWSRPGARGRTRR